MGNTENTQAVIEKARAVKQAHEAELMDKAHVVGVGIGFRHVDGKRTEEIALVVMVDQKISEASLAPGDLLPAEIDGVPVDVQEVGQLRAE